MDRLTPEARSRNMSHVKSKNTSVELMLRKALWAKGIRYRINEKALPGKPDISIKKYRIAIFCDGDFWHGRNFSENTVNTNKAFWIEKIRSNRERDLKQTIELRDAGWTVLRYWGSDIQKDPGRIVNEIIETISFLKLGKVIKKQKKNGLL